MTDPLKLAYSDPTPEEKIYKLNPYNTAIQSLDCTVHIGGAFSAPLKRHFNWKNVDILKLKVIKKFVFLIFKVNQFDYQKHISFQANL